MKLSVLIPIYNAESYIANCLESLVNQDIAKENYEVILMDDGSTDRSVDVVNSYLKQNENIFLHMSEHTGVYVVRNKLIKIAKGDYIYFLDANDYIAHNCFGTLLKYAKEYDSDILEFKNLETNVMSNVILDKEALKSTVISIQDGLKFIANYRNLRHEIWWYFIKKSFLKDSEITFDENEFSGDVVFTLKLLMKSQTVVCFPFSLHRYIQTPESITRSKDLNKKIKLINNMLIMIVNYSKLINSIMSENYNQREIILNNLKFRRDVFVFFTIIKMIRAQLSITEIKEKIDSLKKVEAYPIKNFIGNEYNSITYRLLNTLLNNEIILFSIISLRNSVFKFRLNKKHSHCD
jgi:glycosyltransferase involved in cell wall biosynthesis